MQYPAGTTIAVTDGQKLRVFHNIGDELHLRLHELPEPDVHATSKGGSRKHHQGQSNPAERRTEADSYIAAVAQWLNEQALSGQIQKLYVVAPPRALGELRKHYHADLKSKLLGEMDKEHTHDNAEHLHEALVNAQNPH